MDTFGDTGSLSLYPVSNSSGEHAPAVPLENICYCGHENMGFSLMAKCCTGCLENNQNSEVVVDDDDDDANKYNGDKGLVTGEKVIMDRGQSKVCARGHWKPAEDAKLQELVALYGPQNWNLIVKKLEGRSVQINATLFHNLD